MRRIIYHIFTLPLLMSLFGCGRVSEGTTVYPVTVTLSPSATSLPATATPSPSVTSPPATVTSRPTHTITPSITPTATWVLPSTLDFLEAEKTIRQLLQQDGECQAPCFWGIIPDQTTLEEARNIYSRLNMNIRFLSQEGDQQLYVAERRFEDGFGVYVKNLVQGGIVQGIKVNINNSKGPSPPVEWLAYAPQTLLEGYGLPSKVVFYAGYPYKPGSPNDYYDMVMYFENSDLIVYYGGGETNVGDLMHVCPLVDFSDGASVWLGKNPPNPPLRGIPLEKATTLTKEQFYDLLTRDSGEACFDLIHKVFYPSDP